MTRWITFWCSSLGCPKWSCCLVFQTQGKLKGWILTKETFLKPLIIHRSHWQTVIKVIWKYCEFYSRPSEKEMLGKKERVQVSSSALLLAGKQNAFSLNVKTLIWQRNEKKNLKQCYISFLHVWTDYQVNIFIAVNYISMCLSRYTNKEHEQRSSG